MTKRPLIGVSLGLMTAFVTVAQAGDVKQLLALSIEELVKLEVTIATEEKQTISEAPAVVTVITEQDIRATGASNLFEVLETVPGVHIRHNQFGFRPLVQMRGSNARQTLMMVNGAPLKDLMWHAGIFWKGLPTSMIDRIEVIRGPGSALFGADASAGVINVITKTATGVDESAVGVRAGSFDSQAGWMQYGADWNGLRVSVTGELSTTEGHRPFIDSDGQTLQDASYGSSASLAPGHADYGWDNADLRLSLAGQHWRLMADYARHANLHTGMTGAGVLDPLTEAEDERYNIELLYDNRDFTEDWGVTGELRYHHLQYDSGEGFQEYPPGAFGGDYPDGVINRMASAERRLTLGASALYQGFDDHLLRIGVGHVWQDLYEVEHRVNSGVDEAGEPLPPGGPLVDISGSRYAFAPEKLRKNAYLYLQDVWALTSDWELTAGARYDYFSDFGGTINPRLALVWSTTDKLTSKLLYGEAFRAPSYQELFAETSFSLPDDSLEPEHSRTLELAFSYAASRDLYLGLNLYRFRITDLIQVTAVPGQSKRQYRNAGEQHVDGLELEARWQALRNLQLAANITWRRVDEDGYQVAGEPEQDAYLRLDWQPSTDWNWNLQANWIGERERLGSDSRDAVDAYWLADSTLRYSGLAHWEFAVSVRNLFDEDARDYTGRSIANDLPLPERSFYAEMRYRF